MSSEAKHTPGPWIVGCPTGEDGKPVKYRHISTHEEGLGDIATVWSANRDDDDVEADARLIAAAPDMLAALKDAIWTLDNLYAAGAERVCVTDPRAAIRAAIVMAEGRS